VGGDDNTSDTVTKTYALKLHHDAIDTHVTPSLTEGFHENNKIQQFMPFVIHSNIKRLAFAP